MKLLLPFFLLSAVLPCALAVQYDHSVPQLVFAAGEIDRALAARGTAAETFVIKTGQPGLKPQAYQIRRQGNTYTVLAADANGAMYGALDLAEAIRIGTIGTLANSEHSPHIDRRGIKFNIPLDLRTPSYSDNSDAAQNNIPEMWSFDFWHSFLDEMARHRFNVLTLWNLHPFPSIVKVPEFPDVALDDVLRTKVPFDDSYSHSGIDMFRPELMAKTEVVRKMTIDQKIEFWRDVMAYAQDRGIEVYWFTWNTFLFGAEGKYGITNSQTNPKTVAYLRAAVRETVLTYPLLAGIGITAGEHMENLPGKDSKENWLWNTYGQGIRDAQMLQPNRKIRLIHRFHQTGLNDIMTAFKDYNGPFELSFKYSIAHMYSVPNPPFIKDALPHITALHRTWLTVRDDDIYSFRWGNPEFARQFIRDMPGPDKVAGFYMGPDGFVWGRDYLSKTPDTPPELVISKRWYSFMLWGRLSYEPTLPDSLFEKTLAARFPGVPAKKLFDAWAEASKVFPQITRFFWGDIDVRWFPEACLSHPRAQGFYTVRHFMEGETMPGSGILPILDWREAATKSQRMAGITPLQVADALASQSANTLRMVGELHGASNTSKEFALTIGDMTAMAQLGAYYSEKIRGAADLALFDKSNDEGQRKSAIAHLELAAAAWKRYAEAYTRQYRQPILYNRVGVVDIPALGSKVAQDIEIARGWKSGTIPAGPRKRSADTPFRP